MEGCACAPVTTTKRAAPHPPPCAQHGGRVGNPSPCLLHLWTDVPFACLPESRLSFWHGPTLEGQKRRGQLLTTPTRGLYPRPTVTAWEGLSGPSSLSDPVIVQFGKRRRVSHSSHQEDLLPHKFLMQKT